MLSKKRDFEEALVSYRRALSLYEGLASGNASSVRARVLLAGCRASVARLYAAMGADPGRLAVARAALWKQARASYRQSLEALLELRRQVTLSGLQAEDLGQIEREIARCDEALKELQAARTVRTPPRERSRGATASANRDLKMVGDRVGRGATEDRRGAAGRRRGWGPHHAGGLVLATSARVIGRASLSTRVHRVK